MTRRLFLIDDNAIFQGPDEDGYVRIDGEGCILELDYEAAEIAYSNHEPSKTVVDAAVGEETDDEV